MEERLKANECRIEDIRAELETSPMYNMSLSSKELFHSNLLAWLGNTPETRVFFADIVDKLVGIRLDSDDSWKVEREDKNFDLCIKKEDEYILVIENKVKSIPRKNQLDEYVGKIKKIGSSTTTKFMLLTLANIFPHKKDIKTEKIWEIRTYKDLANAMDMSLLNQEYHKQLIKDYKGFINNLNTLVEEWQQKDTFAETDSLGGLNKLSDLHAKIQFSSYCVKLREKIANIDRVVVYDKNDDLDITGWIKKYGKNNIYIKVDWDFASRGKTGLIDIGIPVINHNSPKIKKDCCAPDYVIKIQVEGRSYRHVIELWKNPQNLVSLGKGNPYTKELKWFSEDPSENSVDVDYGSNSIFNDGLYPESQQSLRNKDSWPFKSYKNNAGKISFIYQSKNIKETAVVDDVLNNIVSEVKRIIETFDR